MVSLNSPIPTSLSITYSGRPTTAIVISLTDPMTSIPVASGAGEVIYSYPQNLPTILSFSYSEPKSISGYQLTYLSFNDLGAVQTAFNPATMSKLTSLSCPKLVNIGTNFSPTTMASLTNLSFPSLANVGNSFTPSTMGALTSLSFPSLESVQIFSPSTMASLTTLDFPSLKYVLSTFSVTSLTSLVTLSFPSLELLGNGFAASSMTALTTISLAGMKNYYAAISVSTSTNVSSVVLGTIGTLKFIGGNITLSGLKLPSSNVNDILALLVSLDGTNGTTIWGSGRTITINGGTNGAPTGQGITDKATLAARGATVTTN